MANKVTRLFRKNRQFPKIDTQEDISLRDLIRDIDKRLGVVEQTLKELIAKEK